MSAGPSDIDELLMGWSMFKQEVVPLVGTAATGPFESWALFTATPPPPEKGELMVQNGHGSLEPPPPVAERAERFPLFVSSRQRL